MNILRTPDERFNRLSGFPFSPHFQNITDHEGNSLRIHYLDEGPQSGEALLLMHGEPSWSYLYRKMIPPLAAAGYRVIAPDLVGFGRSDKPSEQSDYTYQRHVDWMQSFLECIDISQYTLFCQDWGGLIGLRLAAENPQRFVRIVAANTFLPTGDQDPGEAFLKWRNFSRETEVFPVGGILNGATVTELSPEVIAAYDAPFPDESYKAGARIFPSLVPITPDDPASEKNRAAWEVLKKWKKPFLTAFSDSDPITRGGDQVLQKLIPGAEGQKHTTVKEAGHFLQEDKGEELADIVIAFMKGNPLSQ